MVTLLSLPFAHKRPSQGFWGSGEYGHLFQGNKSLELKGTGKQMQFSGKRNIENQDFDFVEQGKMQFFSGEQGNRYPHHPWEGLPYPSNFDTC